MKRAKINNFIIVFTEKGIASQPITPMGKLSGDIIMADTEELSNVCFKKGMFGYSLKFDVVDADVPKFLVHKNMIGYKGQKEDLEALLERYKK